MIRKGQKVYIRPEWQDDGDDEFLWIAIEDEDRGLVKVVTFMPELRFSPVSWIETRMLIAGDSTLY